MIYLVQLTTTPHEARQLEHLGFTLRLRAMHMDGTDTYDVYLDESPSEKTETSEK